MPFYFLSFRGVTGGEGNGISKVRLRYSTIPSLSATTPSYIMFLVHVSHVLHVIFFYFTYKKPASALYQGSGSAHNQLTHWIPDFGQLMSTFQGLHLKKYIDIWEMYLKL